MYSSFIWWQWLLFMESVLFSTSAWRSDIFWSLSCLLSLSPHQRSVCWLVADGQPVCEQTPTVACTRSLWIISTKCWRSIPWWEGHLRPWLSTAWTVSVSCSHKSQDVQHKATASNLPRNFSLETILTSIHCSTTVGSNWITWCFMHNFIQTLLRILKYNAKSE